MNEGEVIKPAVLASNLDKLTSKIARFSGTFDWCKEKFYRSVVERHGDIAELTNTPREDIDDYIHNHLTSHALLDKQIGNSLDELRCELEEVVQDAVAAQKAFSAVCEFALSKEQELRRSVAVAESRVAGLTERLKEHALHNTEVRETVWAITGGKCFYCEVELIRCVGDEQDRSRCFHIDHIVPKSLGGPDHLSNYVPACERCNISKGAKSYVEFLAWRKAQQAPPQLMLIEGGAA